MAKFYGNIGYVKTVETEPGVWEETITEHPYYGEITRNTKRYQSSGGVNDDINISNSISVLADSYANENLQHMRYVVFSGAKWKITDASIEYPRIHLTVGGVYNGE